MYRKVATLADPGLCCAEGEEVKDILVGRITQHTARGPHHADHVAICIYI